MMFFFNRVNNINSLAKQLMDQLFLLAQSRVKGGTEEEEQEWKRERMLSNDEL